MLLCGSLLPTDDGVVGVAVWVLKILAAEADGENAAIDEEEEDAEEEEEEEEEEEQEEEEEDEEDDKDAKLLGALAAAASLLLPARFTAAPVTPALARAVVAWDISLCLRFKTLVPLTAPAPAAPPLRVLTGNGIVVLLCAAGRVEGIDWAAAGSGAALVLPLLRLETERGCTCRGRGFEEDPEDESESSACSSFSFSFRFASSRTWGDLLAPLLLPLRRLGDLGGLGGS